MLDLYIVGKALKVSRWNGEKTKKLRLQHGLGQWEFASKVGVSPKTVENWEEGHFGISAISASKLDRFVRYYDPINVVGFSQKEAMLFIKAFVKAKFYIDKVETIDDTPELIEESLRIISKKL